MCRWNLQPMFFAENIEYNKIVLELSNFRVHLSKWGLFCRITIAHKTAGIMQRIFWWPHSYAYMSFCDWLID